MDTFSPALTTPVETMENMDIIDFKIRKLEAKSYQIDTMDALNAKM